MLQKEWGGQQKLVKFSNINVVTNPACRICFIQSYKCSFYLRFKGVIRTVIFIQSSVKSKFMGKYNMTQYTLNEKLRQPNPWVVNCSIHTFSWSIYSLFFIPQRRKLNENRKLLPATHSVVIVWVIWKLLLLFSSNPIRGKHIT